MASREEFDNLCRKVEELENLVKSLANATPHTHDWDYTGHWSDKNSKRKCLICGLHEQEIYHHRPYDTRQWEKVN